MDVGRSSITTERGAAKLLTPGESLSVNCELSRLVNAPNMQLQSADIKMVVKFRIRLYGTQERHFRFTAEQSSDDHWHWLPQPNDK